MASEARTSPLLPVALLPSKVLLSPVHSNVAPLVAGGITVTAGVPLAPLRITVGVVAAPPITGGVTAALTTGGVTAPVSTSSELLSSM